MEIQLPDGYKAEDFDPFFLSECRDFIHRLKAIKIEKIRISELDFLIHLSYGEKIGLQKKVPLRQFPVYRYLQGDKDEFIRYEQFNYPGIDNEKRLLSVLESIKKHGYPYKNQYIILFSGQNYIRDGQHRAAILAHLYGEDAEIPVMRFIFKGKYHYTYPTESRILGWSKWFLRRVYRMIKKLN